MKRLPRAEPAAAEAARLGEELRDARMALGLSVEDVAAALRIRRVYLAALEDGRVRDLPAPAYAIGFVRSYARALGLDDDDLVRRFRESMGTVAPRKTDLVFPEPVPERGVPAGALVLAGAVVAIAAYVGWWHWSGSGDRVVDAVPPPPPRIQELAAAREPPAPDPVVLPPIGALPLAAGPGGAAGPPAAPPTPTAAAAATARPAPLPNAPAAPPPAVAASVATPAPPPPPPPDAPRILLRASAPVWVQVRNRETRAVLIGRTLQAGETFSVPGQGQHLLSTGNIQRLDITVDGAPYAGFVPGTLARRDVALDPEALRATRIAAPPPPPAPPPRPRAETATDGAPPAATPR
jgi:cytoskeleton protein RodZ